VTAIDDPLTGDEDYIAMRLRRVARAYEAHDLDPALVRFYREAADELLSGKLSASEADAALPGSAHPIWRVNVGLTDDA
jgi:hypothetical protein